MKVNGERIVIFGDSLSHPGADNGPTQSFVTLGSDRASGAPGDLMGSLMLEAGAAAVMLDARVGRSATNYWRREDHANLMGAIVAFQPTKAVVMLGTNDLGLNLETERASFVAIRDALKAAGAQEVWAVGPMTYQAPNAGYNEKAQPIFNVMRDVFGRGFTLDARPLTLTASRSRDGVHFTAAGSKEAALNITQALLSKNQHAPVLMWTFGLVGAIAAIAGGMALARRGKQRALFGALPPPPGALALPPGASPKDWASIINDAYREGRDAEAEAMVEELDEKDRAELRKLKPNAMWIRDNNKDWDAESHALDVIELENDQVIVDEEAVHDHIVETVDDAREWWLEQNGDDVINEGGIPALAWENFRTSAIAATKIAYARRKETDDLDGAKPASYVAVIEKSFKGSDEAMERYQAEQRFKALIRDDDPAAMDVAQDFALQKGMKLSKIAAKDAASGGFSLNPLNPANGPQRYVRWFHEPTGDFSRAWATTKEGAQTIYITVAFDRPSDSVDEAFDTATVIEKKIGVFGSPEYAQKAGAEYAWNVAKAIKSLPPETPIEQVRAKVDQVLDSDTSEPAELYGSGLAAALAGATPEQRAEIKPLISKAKKALKSLDAKTAKLEADYEMLTSNLQDARDDFERSANSLADDNDTFPDDVGLDDDDNYDEEAESQQEELRSAIGEMGAAYPGEDEVKGIGDTLEEWKESLKNFRWQVETVDDLLK